MEITITPQEVEEYEEFKEAIQDDPLYGSTDGLTRVEIVLLAKLLEYQFPNDLTRPITVTIS